MAIDSIDCYEEIENGLNANYFLNKVEISNNSTSILCINIRSFRNKFDEFILYTQLNNYNAEIIIFIETWLYEEEINNYKINNYTSFHLTDNTKRGGGVAIYVKSNLLAQKCISILRCDNYCLGIALPQCNLHIFAIYRTNISSESIEDFFETLDMILSRYKKVYVLGDFNFDILKTERIIQRYMEIVHSN